MTITPRRRWAALVAVAALALAPSAAFADSASPTASAASSAATPSATASAAKTTFTVGFLQDVDSLNPFVGILSSSYEAWGVTYDQLLGYSQKDFSPVPQLASSWSESADHLTWTYKIRPGLKWSDGVPLTAHDAAYTFNRIINGSFEQNNYGNYVANITKAEAPDDTTLILTTSKPTPIMLRLAVYILPEHIWKNIDEKAAQTNKNEPIIGSGPFIFEQHVVGQFIRFRANPNYWAGAPKIKELVFRIFQSEDTMVAALKKGEIDFADSIGSTSYDSLKGDKNITTVPAEYTGFDELAMNTGAATDNGAPIGDGHPALKDKRVRQAINYAIDTKSLVSKVLGGYGEPGTSIIPTIYAKEHYDPGDKTRTFNLDTANQILDDAGYTKGSDGIRTMPGGGKKLSFRLFGRSDSPTSKDSVQYIAGWLAKIGIDVKTQIVSEDNLTQIIGDGAYDMFEWGWVVEPDPDYQLSVPVLVPEHEGRLDDHRRPVGQLLLQPGLRRVVRPAVHDDGPGGPRRDRQADGADALRRRAVRADLLLRRPPGLPQRPVHRVRAAAGQAERAAAVPGSLLVELPVHPAGRHQPVADRPQRRLPAPDRPRGQPGAGSKRQLRWISGPTVGGVIVLLGSGRPLLLARRCRTATADDRE